MRFNIKILFVITLFILGCQKNDPVFMNMLNEMEHSLAKPNLKKFKLMSEDRSISYFHFIEGQYFLDSILRQNNGEKLSYFSRKKV